MSAPETAPIRDSKSSEFAVWRRPFHSLPTRISFFVLAATLCSSLVVTGVSVQSIESLLLDKAEQKYPDMLQNHHERLTLWSRERVFEIRSAAAHPAFAEATRTLAASRVAARRRVARDRLETLLNRRLREMPEFLALMIVSGEGQRLVWAGEPEALPNVQNAHALATDGNTLRPAALTDGRSVQVVRIPISEDDSGRALDLFGVLSLDGLADILATNGLGGSGWSGLVDRDDHVAVSSHGKSTPDRYFGPISPAASPPEVLTLTTPEGIEVLTVAQRLPGSDWAIAIAEPRGEAMEPVVRSIRRALGINLLLISLFALVAYRVSIRLVQPIEALSRAAQRISEGERDPDLPGSETMDEVGMLTRAFSEMARRVDENARALEASRLEVENANQKLLAKNDELSSMNGVLEQLSITDGLTQLHNHRFFQDFLSRECKSADRTGRPLTLILVDVDHFKGWNDRIGHAGGDQILRSLANVMNTLIRGNDLLARYGGEEFALVAPGTDLEGAEQLAEKMRGKIASAQLVIDAPSERENVTVSMGVALYCGDRKALFNDADEALYRAKASGRDCVMIAEVESV